MQVVINCILIGILLGGAQELTKLVLSHKNELRELYPYIFTVCTFYALATYQWLKILKSDLDLTSCYALVVLGVFLGLKVTILLTKPGIINVFSLRIHWELY